jgi:hypothetical protein
MKLEVEPIKGSTKLWLHHPLLGKMHVREFVLKSLHRRGLKPGTVEHDYGLEHALSHQWLKGKSESLRTALQWIDALGYDVYIVKRKEGKTE